MIQLTPAYGRDYDSKKALLADWENNMDFIIADVSNRWFGKPANKRDLTNESVKIYYANESKYVLIK